MNRIIEVFWMMLGVIVMGTIIGIGYAIAFPEMKYPFFIGMGTYAIIKMIVMSLPKLKKDAFVSNSEEVKKK